MSDWMGSLPDGEHTEDQEVYVQAWKALAFPLTEATGMELIAFDPSCTFRHPTNLCESVSLPRWFVELINRALESCES